jgi:hypothetical protein
MCFRLVTRTPGVAARRRQQECLEAAGQLIHEYVARDSPSEINIDSKTRDAVLAAYGAKDAGALIPALAKAQNKVCIVLYKENC